MQQLFINLFQVFFPGHFPFDKYNANTLVIKMLWRNKYKFLKNVHVCHLKSTNCSQGEQAHMVLCLRHSTVGFSCPIVFSRKMHFKLLERQIRVEYKAENTLILLLGIWLGMHWAISDGVLRSNALLLYWGIRYRTFWSVCLQRS